MCVSKHVRVFKLYVHVCECEYVSIIVCLYYVYVYKCEYIRMCVRV